MGSVSTVSRQHCRRSQEEDSQHYRVYASFCGRNHSPNVNAVREKELGVLGNVQKYNVVTNKWCKCKPLNTPRFNFASTVADGKIYVAGGQTAEGTSSTEVYDPSLEEWKSLPNMNTTRYKCVGVTWQGKIHVVGGFPKSGHCDTLWPK